MLKENHIKALILLLFLLSPSLVVAEEVTMKFSLTPTACDGNASYCLPYVDAEGLITSETPKDFKDFLNKNKGEEFNRIIFLESSGGSLVAGMDLAFLIRKHEFDTTILGECYSACTYAFIGGKSREMNEDAKLGVHRFYANRNIGDDKTQQMTAVLSRFLDEMSVSRKMLDIASLTDSSKLTNITRKQAIKLNIVNTVPTLSEWELMAQDNGSIFTCSYSKEHNRDSKAYLCLFNENSRIKAIYTFSINQKFRSPEELKRIYESHNKNSYVLLHLANGSIDLKHSKWKQKDESTFYTSFILENQVAMKILEEKEFELSGDFANFAADIEPKILFTTSRLRQNLLALFK